MAVVRIAPSKIDTSCKEAVADALLNIVGSRISGGGDFGRVVYGASPRSKIVSGFLLPRKNIDDGDEVTSPIWVSCHGLDLQIASTGSGVIKLHPKFSIYLRILPSEKDLTEREDCKLQFLLKKEIDKKIRLLIRDALNARWESIKDKYSSRRECLTWNAIKEDVRLQVLKENGIPSTIKTVLEDNVGLAQPLEQGSDSTNVADGVVVTTLGPEEQLKDELFDSLQIPHKWHRLDLTLPEFELNPYLPESELATAIKLHEDAMQASVQSAILSWLEDDSPAGGKLWYYPAGIQILPSQYKNWGKFITELRAAKKSPAIPEFKISWDIEISSDWGDPSRKNLHIALENRSQDSLGGKNETEHAIFLVSIGLDLPRAIHKPLKLSRIEPSYRYNQYLSYPAIGYNGGIAENAKEGDSLHLVTTWAPKYYQPRIVPISYPGVQRNIRALSYPEGFAGLDPIVAEFDSWLRDIPGQTHLDRGIEADPEAIAREQRKFADDIAKWELEKQSINAGILILKESQKHWKSRGHQSDLRAAPFEAWLAMNEAMANLMQIRTKDDSAEWRLFQLAFVLANIPSIATRMPEFSRFYDANRDDAVTLLYFATGGGKSEAFFGLLLFALFLDRLRGKAFGVTSMIRYPLRLLTIQQAQRAAKVLAQAELVRKGRGYPGEPFSIGFWVGSGGSPNRHSARGVSDVPIVTDVSKSEDRLREDDPKYETANKAWNKLPTCPFCGSQTGLRRFPSMGGTLAHVCTNQDCSCNSGGINPLPFYICDDDIYDLAPSVLLGTVDKLALIGHSARTIRRILGMLGTAPWMEESTKRLRVPTSKELADGPSRHGCAPLYPAYENGLKLFHDPFPALQIQDEAHLLDESLGTFAGLFESTLDAMLEKLTRWARGTIATDDDGNRRRAKVIAASATVSEPERQLEHLYQRKIPALQFPVPGPDIYQSFYAAPQEPPVDEPGRLALPHDRAEERSRIARIYCGFMTNGRPHTSTSVAVLASFHLTITDLFEKLNSDDPSFCEAASAQLCEHVSDSSIRTIYLQKLQDAPIDAIATLIDLHRISLTYVTNKKGGDQIIAAEAEEVRKLHKLTGYEMDSFRTALISSGVGQGEIQQTVDTAQSRVSPGNALPPLAEALRSIVATSAVSHGVDVEELNSMFFAGMPSDIAEYIQASSRVGRTHVGFCVLIPTPQRRRDRYIVEVFDVFHRFLERMVQPAAIDRWAEKAVQRVIPSLFQAYICGVLASREFMRADNDKKANWKSNEAIRDFISQYQADPVSFVDQLSDFLSLAIGLRDDYAPQGKDYYHAQLKTRIRQLLETMAQKQNEPSTLLTFFKQFTDTLQKPMTSLRDVDQAGHIRLARRDDRGNRLSDEDVRDVMALVRHGVAEAGEEDQEGY